LRQTMPKKRFQRSKPPKPEVGRVGLFKSKKMPWALLKIYAFFACSLAVLFVVLTNGFVATKVMQPFTAFVALFSSLLLNLFGSETWTSGTRLLSSDYGIDVVYGCNGAFATAILLSGIIAYPAGAKAKLLGFAMGIPAVFLLNQLRVTSLFLLGRSHPGIFDEVHVYVWQPIIIIFAIFVWDFWARHFVGKPRVNEVHLSG